MLKATATSKRTGESLDLDEISREGKGVEAIAGATGFGLPPVDVQWLESAGDGAQVRNVRVLPRDVDLPLWVGVESRLELKAKVRTISRIFADPVRITLTDDEDGEALYADFVRVGGGTYSYGVDSSGETDWEAILTLRAGQPFWTRGEPSFFESSTHAATGHPVNTVTDPYGLTATRYRWLGEHQLDNDGSAYVLPRWTCHGPLNRVLLEVNNETLEWRGNVGVGESLIIDAKSATVVDGSGVNRYAGLSVAPRFSRLEAGGNDAAITLTKLPSTTRTNYFLNPNFAGPSTTGWTFSSDVSISGGFLVVGNNVPTTDGSVGSLRKATRTLTGLTAGATMQFRWKWGAQALANVGETVRYGPQVTITAGGVSTIVPLQDSGSTTQVEEVREFIVPTDGTVTIEFRSGLWQNGSARRNMGLSVDYVYWGTPGPYFDGDTPDTSDMTYAWTGATNASTSTATSSFVGEPSWELEFETREWMAV